MAQAFDDARGLVFARHSVKGAERLGRRDAGALQLFDDGVYNEMRMAFGQNGRAILLVVAEERATPHGRKLRPLGTDLCRGVVLGIHIDTTQGLLIPDAENKE